MNRSEQIGELVKALAKAQAGLSSIERNRTVKVRTKTGGDYEFAYTTFDAIVEHVRPALTACGLWFTQTLENGDGKYRLVTTLFHESGQWLASETPILSEGGGNQAFGSALTYMKRYALAAMLGIASDDDDDGNEAAGNDVYSRKDKAPSPTPPRVAAPAPKDATSTAAEWAKNQTTVIRTMSSLQALVDWEKNNASILNRLVAKDPKAADKLFDVIREARSKLTNFGMAAE